MPRRYPTAELYEERERDFYRNGRGRGDYSELDVELREATTGRQPNFLRDDYGRTNAGPLARRTQTREIEKEEVTIRERAGSTGGGARSEVDRDEFVIRRGAGPRSTRGVEEDTKLAIRERDRDGPPARREADREEIVFRRGEGDRVRPRAAGREDIVFRRGEGSRAPPRGRRTEDDETVVFKHDENERTGEHKDTLTIRDRSRSRPARGELVAREKEEFVRRRKSPSPPPPRKELGREQIIIRRTERELTPSPSPSLSPPPPPPMPEPIIRPPIHQEIITHHRHIDHGVIRARSPTPPPPPSPPPVEREEELDITIRRRTQGGKYLDEDIVFERESRNRERDFSVRSPSLPAPKPREMWTEVTKDLVIKEAIEARGYDYEENDHHFYIMEYLQYEDVLDLVEISDDIRRDRRNRIREIEYEREQLNGRRGDRDVYEREIIYDSRRGRGYR